MFNRTAVAYMEYFKGVWYVFMHGAERPFFSGDHGAAYRAMMAAR